MQKFFYLFFYIYVFFCIVYGEKEVVINNTEFYLSKDKIFLGDIAQFIGFDENEKEELANIYLKKASLPGYKTIITRELIKNKIEKIYGKVKITSPEKIIINIKKEEIKIADVIKIARDFIKEKMPWNEENVEIEVKNTLKKDELNIPEGEVLLKVKSNFTSNYKGNVVVPVEIYIDGKFYKIVPISFFVKVTSDCLIAKRNIKSKEKLNKEDYEIVKKDITYLPEDIILSEDELENLITKKAIFKGTVLLKSFFDSEPLFKKNSRVPVVVRVKNISVETEGTALDDGRENDIVRVKLDNKKIIEGKVDKLGKVIIEK